MKMLFAAVFLCLVSTALGQGPAYGCLVDGNYHNVGESFQLSGQCVQATCRGNNQYDALGCPDVRASPGYHIVQDPTRPYPGCCPRAVPNSG